MKKITYTIFTYLFLYCFEGTLSSQNSFFIRPALSNKVAVNTKNQNTRIFLADGSEIQYYRSYKNSQPDVTKKLIGLTIGYNFKLFTFETGVLSEKSRFSGRIFYLAKGANFQGNVGSQVGSHAESSGISNLRLPLRIYYQPNNHGDIKRYNSIYFFVGVDILCPSFDAWGKTPAWDEWTYQFKTTSSNETINYQFGAKHKNSFTIAPSLGFMIKLKYHQRIEICNLHLDWHFDGLTETGSHRATFTQVNGFSYTVYNKLSAQGIIFKISRDFNLKTEIIQKFL